MQILAREALIRLAAISNRQRAICRYLCQALVTVAVVKVDRVATPRALEANRRRETDNIWRRRCNSGKDLIVYNGLLISNF